MSKKEEEQNKRKEDADKRKTGMRSLLEQKRPKK